jgi:hypothetical protein
MRTRALAVLVPTLAAAALLGGCVLKQSKPAQTYVLDSLAAPGTTAPRETPLGVVGVLKVTVPGWIDRPQITGRAASGQIVTNEFARWGEPIGRGIERVVAENLAALLPDRRVVAAPFAPSQTIDQRVDLGITEAARQVDGSVLVEARWAVLGPKGETLLQRRSSHRASPTAAGPAGAVAGASEALAGLSRDIADALRALPVPAREEKAIDRP